MSRREFHLHRPCTCAVDFPRINQEALTRGEELLAALLPGGVSSNPNQYVFPRRQRLLSIFCDSGKWLDLSAEPQGADLIGFVAHALRIPQWGAARKIAAMLDIEWRAAPDVDATTKGGQ